MGIGANCERELVGGSESLSMVELLLHECLTTMYRARYSGSSATASGAEADATNDVAASKVHGG